MSYRRFINRVFGWLKNQRLLSLTFCGLFVILALPWTRFLPGDPDATIIGVPSGLFVLSLITPLVGMFLLSFFLGISEDNDRHDPELENE